MKKILSILLCGLFLLTSLSACNNNPENSSEVSSQQDISNEAESSTENTFDIESSVETSQEISQEPEPYISEIPENAVYFTSYYFGKDFVDSGSLFGNRNLREYYSCKNYKGLIDYFKNNEVPDDTYFLVGMMASTYKVDYDYRSNLMEQEGRQLMRSILEPYDFIEWENHKMLFDENYLFDIGSWREKYKEYDFSQGTENYYRDCYEIVKKYMNKRFPDMEYPVLEENPMGVFEHEDMKYYYYGMMLTYRFDIIGYINAKDLKQLNEDLRDSEQIIGITWFPAPDDQERWLTANPYYNPED